MSMMLRPLRQRSFALLWGATMLANLGFWTLDLTMAWLIAGLTSSPSMVSLVPAAGMLPIFLLALPAGAFGDAVDKRRFLVCIQALFVLLLVAFATLVALDRLTMWLVVGFAFLHGSLAAIASPARQAVLPSIVDQDNVRGAVMLSALGFNGSRAIGPVLGGFMLAHYGPTSAIALYAFACLAVGIVIYVWRQKPEPRLPFRVVAQSVEGVRYVLTRAQMREPLGLSLLYFLSIAPLWAFAPLIAKGFASGDSSVFGLFMMALGIGAVVGGFSSKLAANSDFASVLGLGGLLSAAALFMIGTSTSMTLTLAGFFIAGLGWIAVSAGINSHVLVEAQPAFRSRMISMVLIVFSGGLGLGSLAWGQAARFLGVPGAFMAGAGCLSLLALSVLVRSRIRA
jgi:predicted MFS family arabinose efflux permease